MATTTTTTTTTTLTFLQKVYGLSTYFAGGFGDYGTVLRQVGAAVISKIQENEPWDEYNKEEKITSVAGVVSNWSEEDVESYFSLLPSNWI